MVSRDEVMKSRETLMMETIELENSLMKYKKGLHLAKRFIDTHVGDSDLSSEMIEAHSAYKVFLKDNGLEGI